MNAKQTAAYQSSGLPEYDPQARAAFIAGWRAACKVLKSELNGLPTMPHVMAEIRARLEEIPQ